MTTESEPGMPKNDRNRNVIRATVRIVTRLALLAFALLVVFCVAVVIVLPRATHGVALTVLTGSMTPEIPVGSVVLVRPVDPRTLEPGDIATYQREEGKKVFVTHRVVKVHDEPEGLTFTFKGDANRGADVAPIPAGAVRGEVWFHVPYLGGIRDALHGKGGVTLLGMLLLAGYAISQVSAGLRERRTSQDSTRSSVEFDGPVLLAEFERGVADAISVDELVSGTRGLLVAMDEQRFTVLCRPSPDSLHAAADLLEQFRPTRLLLLGSATLRGDAQPLEQAEHSTEERVDARVDA